MNKFLFSIWAALIFPTFLFAQAPGNQPGKWSSEPPIIYGEISDNSDKVADDCLTLLGNGLDLKITFIEGLNAYIVVDRSGNARVLKGTRELSFSSSLACERISEGGA